MDSSPLPSGSACGSLREERKKKLDQDLKAAFNSRGVPYFVQREFSQDGDFTTLEDLADRWVSDSIARAQSPDDCGFKPGISGFDAKSSGKTAMRLMQAVRDAKNWQKAHPKVSVIETHKQGFSDANGPNLLSNVKCDRDALEKRCLMVEGFNLSLHATSSVPTPHSRDNLEPSSWVLLGPWSPST